MKKQDEFLARHGITPEDDFVGYHYAYALYAFYMIDAMQKAEEVEDGLLFDEDEIAVLLVNLKQAQQTMRHFRRKLNIAPVKNAISLDVSSGFVEGNNNKFKLLKRIVYGRSGLVNLAKKCFLAFRSKDSSLNLFDLI